MIAGIALYLKGVNPKIRIVGVQADSVAPLENFKQTDELKCGPGIHMCSRRTPVPIPSSICLLYSTAWLFTAPAQVCRPCDLYSS